MVVVSCLAIPRGLADEYRARYVCFRSDYRIFFSNEFHRGTLRPPKVPSKPCIPPFELGPEGIDPQKFAEHVQVPCYIRVPCHALKAVRDRDGRVVGLEPIAMSAEECMECVGCTGYLEEYDEIDEDLRMYVGEGLAASSICREYSDVYCAWSLRILNRLMLFSYRRFGAVLAAVFIGKRRAYPAPWSPSMQIYRIAQTLAELGYLDRKFLREVAAKYGAYTVYQLLGFEEIGEIKALGYNFYQQPSGRYESVALVWVENDAVARRYALRVWDLHASFARTILGIVRSLPSEALAQILERIGGYGAQTLVGAPTYPASRVGEILARAVRVPDPRGSVANIEVAVEDVFRRLERVLDREIEMIGARPIEGDEVPEDLMREVEDRWGEEDEEV